FVLGTATAGYLVGVTSRWPVAGGAVLAAVPALTWAHQLTDPGVYPVADDVVFSLVSVGALSIGGAGVQLRAAQVRELKRVAALLEAQRETEVRAARLAERNRVEIRLHRGFSEHVAAIAMRAESAVGADADGVRQALADIERAARACLDELREALGSLGDEPATNRAAAKPLPAPAVRVE